MTDQPPIRMLIVDDQRSIRDLCATLGRGMGLVCFLVESAGEALERMESDSPELVLAGLGTGANSGLQLLGELKRRWPRTEVTMMGDRDSMETAVQAIGQGAYDFVVKSFRVERFQLVMERMVEKVRLVRENEILRSRLQGRTQSAPPPACTDLEELERLTVERVFAQVAGDKEQAQRLLGISRATLYRKIKLYGLGTRAAPKKSPTAALREPRKRVVVWS